MGYLDITQVFALADLEDRDGQIGPSPPWRRRRNRAKHERIASTAKSAAAPWYRRKFLPPRLRRVPTLGDPQTAARRRRWLVRGAAVMACLLLGFGSRAWREPYNQGQEAIELAKRNNVGKDLRNGESTKLEWAHSVVTVSKDGNGKLSYAVRRRTPAPP